MSSPSGYPSGTVSMPALGSRDYTAGRTTGQKGRSAIQTYRDVPQYKGFIEVSRYVAPLTYLLDNLGKTAPVTNKSFFHLEGDVLPTTVTVSGAVGTSTTLVLASTHGYLLKRYDVLFCPRTGEQIYVSGTEWPGHSTTATVTRGHGTGVAATALVDGDILLIMASTFPSGGEAPGGGMQTEPKQITNYCQICREAREYADRLKQGAAGILGPNEVARQERLAYDSMLIKVERSMLMGRMEDTTGVTTGGVISWLASNTYNQNSVQWSEIAFSQFLRDLLRYNGSAKNVVLLMGEYAMQYLDAWGRDKLMNRPEDKIGGISFQSYRAHGTEFKLISHPMFQTHISGTTPAGWVLGVNLDMLEIAAYQNRWMKRNTFNGGTDISVPGTDGEKSGWLCDFGIKVANEAAHGLVYGIPAVA